MNIFENLLDELREENLLEKTVIETKKSAGENETGGEKSGVENLNSRKEKNGYSEGKTPAEKVSADLPENFETVQNRAPKQKPRAGKIVNQTEFFRKRAVNEVGGLQTVERIFSGVERQQKKTVPKPYDDLTVIKALHDFLQISEDVKSPAHASAEFQLMQETESWYSALSHRDKQISITHLRRYCETAKPVLSSEAQDVKKVNIDNSSLKEYVKDARIGNNTFIAIVLPSWNALSEDKKEEVLKKIVSVGDAKGFKNVHLISDEGKSVGSAAPGSIEVKN